MGVLAIISHRNHGIGRAEIEPKRLCLAVAPCLVQMSVKAGQARSCAGLAGVDEEGARCHRVSVRASAKRDDQLSYGGEGRKGRQAPPAQGVRH